ncbi:MAG: hypothetical protein ACD_51C00021G0007 [uncultured bacterium]|nr:MAG: hypothetical protein ACD_51C00021G0007 [uncultured bacterium]OGJ47578.1 MAG: hypothetical protein A2244_00745 [Candidatus Peregrinibacteria bacterium RIFOXYA2_FULL_41_18]OGJ49621.1 MAG: hypothetical protein A2344_02365 [Candidatus Peregrinibacteria bacterium RIFOXYB12_FULL_41_12]OGJ53141.1 MAG: hypothetical protein A2448_03140 [Candidatus Peregrinibacteria bacterium RIFOXYC2_FULL_41_22]OGJ54428.1 MAG: hypothetical protein A2336_01280 [Candidatus Peregrinibacteria bacterium RIFOXYB2_FULL
MLKQPEFQHIFIGREKVGFSKCYHAQWDEDLGEDAAQLVLNIDIRSTKIPGSEVADAMFDVFKNNFFQDLEKDPYSRFEESLKMMNNVIAEKESAFGVKFLANVSVIVAAIAGGSLYLSQHGDAEAYLVRKRHVNVISDGLHDANTVNKELFANVASGTVIPGDVLVYSTSRLYRYITKMDLAKVFSDYELGDGLKELSSLVSMELADRISVCGIGIVGGGQSDFGSALPLPNEKAASPSRPSLFSKLTDVIGDNKVVNFLSEKLADLKHLFNKGGEQKATSEWRRLGRDKVLISLILVVLVLIAGIYLVRNQGQKQKYIEELEAKLATASDNISQAETKGSYDKDAAAELLDQAEEIAMEVLSSGYLRSSASQYLSEIEEQRGYLDNIIKVTSATMVADLSKKRTTVNALGLAPYQESIYAYEYNGLYEIELNEVKDPLTIDDEEVVIDGSYFEDQDTILFYTQDGEVIEYDGMVFSKMDSADGGFKVGVQAEPYSTKLYILDPTNNQIWKYYREREGYGSAEGYNIDADLSNAVAMAIDGAVWVLNNDGTITKLLSGTVTDYNLERAPLSGFEGANKIYTSFESSQLYVLDSAASKVLVFNKDAKDGDLVYSTQYVFDGVGEIKDIYVAQDEGRMYLATATAVWVYEY